MVHINHNDFTYKAKIAGFHRTKAHVLIRLGPKDEQYGLCEGPFIWLSPCEAKKLHTLLSMEDWKKRR